jgi:hypothetical protein
VADGEARHVGRPTPTERSRMGEGRANGTARPGNGAAFVVLDYPVELPIVLEGGAGLTRVVSREEVRFSTDLALAGGQQVAGHLRFPDLGEAAGLVLRFVASVACVRPADPPGDAFEVRARFERLDLVPEDAA